MKGLHTKLKPGKKPSEKELENYLKAYHDQAPGVTPDKITRYKTSGPTSYELLIKEMDALPTPPQTIVDLACGNGALIKILLEKFSPKGQIIGVDMSDGELEKARKTIQSKNVKFLCERAQSLSLTDHSADAVLCHLAFMLMKPIEPVIREVKRILKPEGLFAGIVLISDKEGTLFGQFSEMVGRFLKEEFSDLLGAGFGDPRVKTKEGLLSLFPEKNWRCQEMKLEEGEFLMSDTADALWENLKGFYLPNLLSDKNRRILGKKVCELFSKYIDSQGIVPFCLPFRFFAVKRLGRL